MEFDELKGMFTSEAGELTVEETVLQNVHSKISEEIKSAHSGTTNRTLSEVDTFISEITGLEKDHGELTGAFVKRAFEVQNSKTNEAGKAKEAELKAQIEEAKKAGSQISKEQLEQLQSELVKTREEMTKREEDFKSQLMQIERKNSIQAIESKLNFNPNLPAALLAPYMEAARAKAIEIKTIEADGKLYASEDGIRPLIQNDKTVLIEDYVKGLYKDILAPEAPRGNGSQSDAGQTAGGTIEGKSQTEAYTLMEKKLKAEKLSDSEVRAKLRELVTSDVYNALPMF